MSLFGRIKSAVVGNPVTKEYELGRHVASAGPGLMWKVYHAVKKSTRQVHVYTCTCQGSAHTGQEWSALTTTQLFLPPLELKLAYFYHHSERIVCYIQCNIMPFHYSLATTQIILGRTLTCTIVAVLILIL